MEHVQQGRSDLAIPLIQQLLATAPNDVKARNLLGIALLNSGRREEAAVEFRKAVAVDARFSPALKNLALAEMALGKPIEARAHFEQVLKLVPNDQVAHFQLGELEYSANRYSQAVAHYERSGDLYSKEPGAAVRALRAAVYAHKPSFAIGIAERLEPTVDILRLVAQAHEQSGNTQRAYDALRSATKLEPGTEAPYLDLMALCLEHRTWDLALDISEVAIGHLPQSWRVRVQRGAVLALKGDVSAAESEFQQATQIAPRETLPPVALALARVQLDRVPEALDGLRQCRTRNPRDFVTAWILGETLAQQGSDDEALGVLEDAARLGPREAAPKVLLGKLLARRGDLTGAARELEAALRIQPDDVGAQYQLAVVYRKAGNLARAEELFRKVGDTRSDNPGETAKHSLEQIIRRPAR